jgi:hypothetical protein
VIFYVDFSQKLFLPFPLFAFDDFFTVPAGGTEARKNKTLASTPYYPQVRLGDLLESHFNITRTHPVWS